MGGTWPGENVRTDPTSRSFPRTRESSLFDTHRRVWPASFPACAGMSGGVGAGHLSPLREPLVVPEVSLTERLPTAVTPAQAGVHLERFRLIGQRWVVSLMVV